MLNNKHEQLSAERKQLQAQGRIPEWYSTPAWKMFKEKYMVESEGDVKTRYQVIAKTLAKHLPKQYQQHYEDKFFNLMWENILSPSSPVLANVGTNRGECVSCSGQYIGDSVNSFFKNLHETALLTKHGFGTSGYFGDIRQRGEPISTGGKADGAKPVMESFFECTNQISQGGMRKGSFAGYVNIEDPVFEELVDSLFIEHTGKNYGWNISDKFINRLKEQEPIASEKWEKALHAKALSGKGYLFFPDKANRHRPQMYKDLGLDIKATNLCTEIMLHSSEEYTYSCILSSINLYHWDKIKASNAVFDSMVFLDCLCSEFIESAKDKAGLEKVVEFTRKGRAVGLGVMGFATYLQSKRIIYDSLDSLQLNQQIFKHIHDETLKASQWLAQLLGEPEWCKGYGVRNTHRTAIAPTKSTAGLMGGMSESVFQDPAWVFTAGSSVGELPRIPPVFLQLMKDKGVYNQETITDIIQHLGSVQHVDWLDDHEKQVFKNAYECYPYWNYLLARERQKYLCQGQSLNFFIPDNEHTEELLSDLMTVCALDEEILSVYYVYMRNGVVIKDECTACSA